MNKEAIGFNILREYEYSISALESLFDNSEEFSLMKKRIRQYDEIVKSKRDCDSTNILGII